MLLGLLFNWCSYGIFNTPTKLVYSLVKYIFTAANSFRPLASGESFTFVFIKNIPACVGSLLLCCSPFAIFRSVVTIIIKPIYAMFFRWSFTHIFYEGFKFMPRFTNRYTSKAIVFIVEILGVIASLNHCRPNGILRCTPKSVSCSFTSTRCSSSRLYFSRSCKVLFATITKAFNFVNTISVISAFTNNGEKTKLFINQNNDLKILPMRDYMVKTGELQCL